MAVIVILALIALIAVPLILNIVEESRKNSFKNSVYGIIKAVELATFDRIGEKISFFYNDSVESSNIDLELQYNGEKPINGEIKVLENGRIILALHNGDYCVTKTIDNSEVKLDELSWENCNLPGVVEFSYTGSSQEFIAPRTGKYLIELWGASGGDYSATYHRGRGSYNYGVIELLENENIYVYVGESGKCHNANGVITVEKSWNGGGNVVYTNNNTTNLACNGGGATDIRLVGDVSSTWNAEESLISRIMVSAGGGGSVYNGSSYGTGGAGGGLIGYDGELSGGNIRYGYGGTQTAGGKSAVDQYPVTHGGFGFGGSPASGGTAGGGGAGYYGGGAGVSSGNGAGGGSSFISGHHGVNAVDSNGNHTGEPNHYSGKLFSSTLMIDGNGYSWGNEREGLVAIPNPENGYYDEGEGHVGDGFARITLIE